MSDLVSVQTIYTSRIGMVTISSANGNLNGDGAVEIITGAAKGTLIKTLIIKAQTDTEQGMVRLFVDSFLLMEVEIPYGKKSSRDCSYYNVIPLNYTLGDGVSLRVTTQVANTFNIIAEAFNIDYSDTELYIGTSLKNTAKTGKNVISDDNPNLDGTGDMEVILDVANDVNGCTISSIIIKALDKTDYGMVRMFIQNEAEDTPVLFMEVFVPASDQSATAKSFSHQAIGQGSLCLEKGFKILASTEVENDFSVVIEGSDWIYE